MTELNRRQQAVLKAVVELYIHTSEPVGSKAVTQWMDSAVSSATIRNEMAELCAGGLLEQPHTSAGRVPTVAAYRYYIDRLMDRRSLSRQSRQEIDDYLGRCAGDPDRLMNAVVGLLSDATGYAAVTTAPASRDVRVRRLEVLPLSSRSAMLVLITSSGMLRSRVCRFSRDVEPERLNALLALLSNACVDQPLTALDRTAAQKLLLCFGEDALWYAPLLTAFCALTEETAEAEVLCGGQLNLLQLPDYGPGAARSLLEFLSRREELAHMMSACSDGLHVVLGEETPRPELLCTSIIVTPYVAGTARGTLGLVGPVRMDYAATIPRLEYVAQTVGRLLSDLLE